MYGLKKLAAGRYEYLGHTITREKRMLWRVGACGGRETSFHPTLGMACQTLGDEEVPTRNLMSGAEIMIPRRQKGTALDPSQERYWSA